MKSRTVCKIISDKDYCERCGNPTSDNWSGLLIITASPYDSELARELNIKLP